MSSSTSQPMAPKGAVQHGRQKTVKPLMQMLRFLGISVAVLAVSATSIVAIETWRAVADIDVFVLHPGESEGPPPDIAAMPGGFNMLLIGSDKGETAQEIKDRGSAELNDVTMILHVSEDHTNAVAVSIPRDMVVPIPACPKEDGSGNHPRMSGQPINVTLHYGGIPCTVLTVEALTGLRMDFAALITFNGVIKMSTALGGVPVCLKEPIKDRYSGFNRPAGEFSLKGWEALAFLRSRHGVGDGSDLTRISSQQVFLSSMVRTIKSQDTLGDPVKLYNLALAATQNMQLSENLRHVDTLVSIARALADLDLDKVTFVQYPGTTGQPGIYLKKVMPIASVAKALFDKIRADEPFALESAGDGRGSVLNPNATPLPTDPDATVDPNTPALPVIRGLRGQTAADQTCSAANHG